MKNYLPLLLIFSLVVAGCSKDDDDPTDENTEVDCSTITATYTNAIKSIIDSNCGTSGCHDGSNPRPIFDTYDAVFAGRTSIRSRVVAKTMPPPSKPALTQDQIDMINCWVQNGAAE